jgi:hypothetical protein
MLSWAITRCPCGPGNNEKPEKHWIARTEPGNDQFFDITEIQSEKQFCIHGAA